MYYKSVSAIAGGGKTAVLLNTFSKGLARCSGSNWVFFPDPNWLCAPGANKVDYKAIGQRIKIARIKKGVTQETVADLIDITPAHMSNVETGKTKVSLPTLIAIANALSVSVDTLLCDNVIASKIVFEKEAKDIFSDCDEYEVRFLVDLMKSAKIAFRKDKDIRNQFQK